MTSEPMDKVWLYNSLIEMVKKTGQGIPCKLFAMKVPGFYTMVEDLEAEGRVKRIVQHNSYLPDDEWLCPTKGYCVEEDGDQRTIVTGSLTFLRYYKYSDEQRDDPIVPKFPTYREAVKANQAEYIAWLKRNINALIETDFLEPMEREVVDKEMFDWIKTRSWYTENKTILECLKESEKAGETHGNDVVVAKKIEGLYKEWSRLGALPSDKQKDRDKNLEYMKTLKRVPIYRSKFKYLVESVDDSDVWIQDFISELEKNK